MRQASFNLRSPLSPLGITFFRESRARSLMDLVCVALKSIVCREGGRYSRMLFSWSRKPMSKILSASSNTSTWNGQDDPPRYRRHDKSWLCILRAVDHV